jgi:hypothetical protein
MAQVTEPSLQPASMSLHQSCAAVSIQEGRKRPLFPSQPRDLWAGVKTHPSPLSLQQTGVISFGPFDGYQCDREEVLASTGEGKVGVVGVW